MTLTFSVAIMVQCLRKERMLAVSRGGVASQREGRVDRQSEVQMSYQLQCHQILEK